MLNSAYIKAEVISIMVLIGGAVEYKIAIALIGGLVICGIVRLIEKKYLGKYDKVQKKRKP